MMKIFTLTSAGSVIAKSESEQFFSVCCRVFVYYKIIYYFNFPKKNSKALYLLLKIFVNICRVFLCFEKSKISTCIVFPFENINFYLCKIFTVGGDFGKLRIYMMLVE